MDIKKEDPPLGYIPNRCDLVPVKAGVLQKTYSH